MRSALDIGPLHPDVCDVRHLLCERDLAKGTALVGTKHRLAPSILSPGRRAVVHRNETELIPFIQVHRSELGSTCLSVKGSTWSRRRLMAPTGMPSRSSGT